SRSGAWTETLPTDSFDFAPFRRGVYSSGDAADEIVWTKPATLTVRAFDLYSFPVPDAGRWQYRVDDGPWTSIPASFPNRDAKLPRYCVAASVERQVAIRGHDGTAPCIAPVMGVGTYPTSEPP